jgi:phosphoribosylglycinamide formyltransferase 2
MNQKHLKEAQDMAAKVTAALGGAGIWGVEFFITAEGAYFSELSPRPHDTGMVTLGKTQNLNEFELHARAILSMPIPEVKLLRNGASAVVLAKSESTETPVFEGIEDAMNTIDSEVRLFGKPATRPYRRMGVTLKYGTNDVKELVEQAKDMASKINVK